MAWRVTAIHKAPLTKPDSETAQKIIGQAPPPAACWETTAPGREGTCQSETAQDPGGLEYGRGAFLHNSGRGCISTQRVQKVPWHLGLFVGGPEEAEPWRPVVRQVQPPSVWGRPSAGVALSAAPPARPRDRSAPRSLVTSGRGRPQPGGTQPEDRQAACHFSSQGGDGVAKTQRNWG